VFPQKTEGTAMAIDALDYITVKGFKSIRSIEKLELRPINILIGPNGSGKSNLLGVFAFLHEIREGRLQNYVIEAGGAEKILHFGSKESKQIEIDISFRNAVNKYSLVLAPSNDDNLYPKEEVACFWDKKSYPNGPYKEYLAPIASGKEAGVSDPRLTKTANWVRAHLSSWRRYQVHDTSSSSPLRKTANINDNGFLRQDGANLAAFLNLLQEKYPDSYSLIRQTIRRVAPFFDDFNLSPLALNPDSIKLEWKHTNSAQYFDASSFSDGSLRFIFLATLFLQPSRLRPSVILIDEPELGLHPYAIELLASLIRQASKETQVIAATQSSLLLDHFDPEDILVANRIESATTIKRLQPEHLAEWLSEYSLGQLWEKGEFAGRPEKE
jgi:predicted ATPase